MIKLLSLVSLCAVLSGCATVDAAFPQLSAVDKAVAADLAAGASDEQMASDVCKALNGSASTDAICADVALVVQDSVAILVDTHVLGDKALANAKAFKLRHPAE